MSACVVTATCHIQLGQRSVCSLQHITYSWHRGLCAHCNMSHTAGTEVCVLTATCHIQLGQRPVCSLQHVTYSWHRGLCAHCSMSHTAGTEVCVLTSHCNISHTAGTEVCVLTATYHIQLAQRSVCSLQHITYSWRRGLLKM